MSIQRPALIRRLFGDAVSDFLTTLLDQEAFSGFVLTGALASGVIWATASSSTYQSFVSASIHLPGVPSEIVNSTETLVSNLLMIVFFAAIGLEIARERTVGTLRDSKTAVAPVIAALGGMAMAAVTFVAVVAISGEQGAGAGWGIPMATDVAFTLGALSLIGTKVSRDLRVFLLTLAIADDVASVIVLAVTSHHGSSMGPRGTALFALLAVATVVAAVVARSRFPSATVFIALALIGWWALAHLGIEPTLAGVIIGVLVPTGSAPRVVGLRLERAIAPVSAFLILPIFAIVAGGVDVAARPWAHQGGLVSALLISRSLGKVLGIVGGVALVVRIGAGRLPSGTSWAQMMGAALLCGIGFTVPLLFAAHAFGSSPPLIAATKIGLLVASIACAGGGLAVIALTGRRGPDPHE